ncbi:non-lysosomal glucosylceramidase isoform X2 [Daktulosphaira vitifoliae]|nr:non-lysosomal glucosylceramidase isoform X2 [Daktulosphaira vitifoliae]
MDFYSPVQSKHMYGVPLGGIGGGTIGRGFKGEFCRYQVVPGMYEYETIRANQFIVNVQNSENITIYNNVLSSLKCNNKTLYNWKWEFPENRAQYTGLYPRSWTEYFIPELDIKLICRQVSPIIPNNYKDSCVPGGVFIWNVENNSIYQYNISITFTFASGNGVSSYNTDEANCEPFNINEDGMEVAGSLIHNFFRNMKCTYVIGGIVKHNGTFSQANFDPNSNGISISKSLKLFGELKAIEIDHNNMFMKNKEVASAICIKKCVKPHISEDYEFGLFIDMPKIKFPASNIEYLRYYTKFFGCDNKTGPKICHYSMKKYKFWEEEIEKWQNPVLKNVLLPDWYKSAIFNELYYIADGGSVWLLPTKEDYNHLDVSDPRFEYGYFGYLEGHEYRMYNTYDVHFYGSFALATLWPKLQYCIQYQIRDTINDTLQISRKHLVNGVVGLRKYKHSVPHDLGDPEEDPFNLINAYLVHDVSEWRDLNLKFVLQCYRDYTLFKDKKYLYDMFPQIEHVMERSLLWDTDNDGMIENSGSADQTYDTWIMTGVSAYCGSLWLAALYSTIQIAKILEYDNIIAKYSEVLLKAKTSFNNILWNGDYYDFDSSGQYHSKSIMADQLCGQWYLKCCDVEEEVFPTDQVLKALSTIYKFNVQGFNGGTMGAVNGMMPNGNPDTYTIQSEEVWTGVTYALSSLMISQGLREEGFNTAKGIYDTVYNSIGMAYETPEAFYSQKAYRSAGYMRPLSIWSIQLALENISKKIKS